MPRRLPIPLFTFMCEDIRQEAFGKISLLGLYADSIYFKDRSMTMRSLAFFNRFSEGEGVFRVKGKLKAPSNQVVAEFDLKEVRFEKTEMNVPTQDFNGVDNFAYRLTRLTHLATVAGNVSFKEEGVHSYELYFDEQIEPHVQFTFLVAVDPDRFK
jgi:hypothetical protein